MAQNLNGLRRENRRNAKAFALASKAFRNELAKGKTYPTLASFCTETGLALKTLRKHPEEYDEALSRVSNHSLEIDKGYSFRYPHAIEERILEALEHGPLELQEMIEILKFPGVSHGARHTHRCGLDRLLSANGNLYRYEHVNKYRRKFVIFSLGPMTRFPWDDDL